MNRTEFEKIVGGATCNGNNIIVKLGWLPDDGLVVLNQGRDLVTINIEDLTPFRLRCLLHGLGIKCDWDEPVTFERLMELDGAISDRNNTQVIFVLGRLPSLRFAYSATLNSWVDRDTGRDITTMKQVHILLEAAGVGR